MTTKQDNHLTDADYAVQKEELGAEIDASGEDLSGITPMTRVEAEDDRTYGN